MRKNRGQHGRQRRFLTDIPTHIPTKPHRAAHGVRRLPGRNVLPGGRGANHRRRGDAARGLGDGAGGPADLRRRVGRPWRAVRAGLDSGGGQRNAVRSYPGDLRDTGRGCGHRDGCESRRPSGWPRQRAGPAGDPTRRPHRHADRTARTVGGRGSAIHPRHIRCASYAFGAFGIPLWQMAVGSFIGSAPRAFAYTALGASIRNLSSPLAYAAIAVWCLSAIVGAFAARRGYRKWRGQARHSENSGMPDSDREAGTR